MGYRDKMSHRLAHLARSEMLALHRRDSHGSHIKLNVPEELDNKANFIHNNPGLRQKAAGKAAIDASVDVQTVESIVYVTVPQDSLGDAQLVTASSQAAPQSSQNAAAAYESAKNAAGQAHTRVSTTPAETPAEATSSASLRTVPEQRTRSASAEVTSQSIQTGPIQHTRESSSAAPLQTGPVANTRTSAAADQTQGAAVVGGTPLSATSNADSLIGSKDEGMSGGAKAGLAFGIIIALAMFFGLIFFCWRRKRSQKNEGKEQIVDEKHGSFFDRGLSPTPDQRASMASTRTASTAPRLSLRPVTQFLPNIMDNRNPNGTAAMSEKPKSGWERGPGKNPFEDGLNEKTARPDSPPSNPFDEGDGSVAVAAAGGHSREGSGEPATPKSAKFDTAATVPVGSKGPNNVHRVQLEFKPSMDDELELVSGQLVRMLHEYDDGWALCIRMDRSQQGVCPRTCLSKLPVKPRPQGPPPNGQRPMGPPPNGAPRSFSPAGPPNGNMVPRPLTPNSAARERAQTMGRSSPAPQESVEAQRQRSQSVADGAGVPSRKPVPGMAM